MSMENRGQHRLPTQTTVVGMMKIGNIVPRAGIKYMSLTFWAIVLMVTPCRLPNVTTISTPACLCSSLPQWLVQTATLVPLEM